MRKIIASINLTLDGFMAGPDCELDWHFNNWTRDMAEAFGEQLSQADTIILGRVTYCAMAGYWTEITTDLSFPREDMALAGMMNDHTKIVFSRTLPDAKWNNSRLIGGNIKKEILSLKRQAGKDMIVYGSASVLHSLEEMGLVDEYICWVHPVILGSGRALFTGPGHRSFRLTAARTFGSGVVVLAYSSGCQPVPGWQPDNARCGP